MGCDIHIYVETLKDGQWQSADKWKTEDDYTSVDGDEIYEGRNYNLFAILADVRNGRGFAGIKTGEGFNPIADPKGIPDDVSPEVKTVFDQWDGDGHSHSYFTVAELLAFDWTQTSDCQGWVNGVDAEKWLRMRRWEPVPNSYSGGVSGRDVKHIEMEEMEKAIAGLSTASSQYGCQRPSFEAELKEKLGYTYALAKWTITYAACCKEFWWSTIPKLLTMGKPDEVRIIFCFDN